MTRLTAFRAHTLGLTFASLIGLCSPAFAQDGAPSSAAADEAEAAQAERDDILVSREIIEVTPGKVRQQARKISVTGNIFHTPIARVETYVCPGIIGLPLDYALPMVDRIRERADELDIRLGSDGCDANMIVMFTQNGQKLVQAMYKKNSLVFGSLSVKERRDLLADPGPVHVWTRVETKGRDGQRMSQDNDTGVVPTINMWGAHSRIYKPIRNDITAVTIVIDSAAAGEKTIGQLADYVVMRGLVRTKPSPEMAMSSILGLFEAGGHQPNELTEFDHAYLSAIYDGMPNIPAATKIGGVNRELRRIIKNEETSAN